MQESLKNIKLNFVYASPKFGIGTLLVTFISTFILIMATFTQLKLTGLQVPLEAFIHPIKFLTTTKNLGDFMTNFYYIPQVPVVLFIAAFLGRKFGVFSIFIYVSLGLFGFPIFASGGGLGYYSQYGFGYILSYFFAVSLVAKLLHKKISVLTLFQATIIGVFIIHIIGIIYLTVLLLLEHNSLIAIAGWIWILSVMQLIYDIALGFIAITLGCTAKSLLWIVME